MGLAMELGSFFKFANLLAVAGWVTLAFAPLMPRLSQIIAGGIIPAVLSLAYAVFVLVGWSSSEGGYDTLENVMRLFDDPMIALAGWVHFLAFDLFAGAWQVRVAQRESFSHWIVLPCLLLTFLFGPAGLLLFMALRLAMKPFPRANNV